MPLVKPDADLDITLENLSNRLDALERLLKKFFGVNWKIYLSFLSTTDAGRDQDGKIKNAENQVVDVARR